MASVFGDICKGAELPGVAVIWLRVYSPTLSQVLCLSQRGSVTAVAPLTLQSASEFPGEEDVSQLALPVALVRVVVFIQVNIIKVNLAFRMNTTIEIDQAALNI